MIQNKYRIELIHILNDLEDYLKSGYRKPRGKISLRDEEQGAGAENTTHKAVSDAEGKVPRGGLSDAERAKLLAELEDEVRSCEKCRLSQNRKKAVPGQGVLDPDVLVIGEGPGADEDRQGIPFVGRAGQYLDKWLDAIGLSRKQNVYIANIVKCRPPENRDPRPDESDSCLPYLRRQIELLEPVSILALGRVSAQVLSGRETGIGRLRGETYYYMNIPVIPTYHPSAVLRDQSLRKAVWGDLKRLRKLIAEIQSQTKV